MNIITNLDFQLTNFISSLIPHNQFFNYLFAFFSLRGNSIFIWVIVIILVLVFEERKNPGISKKDIRFISLFIISFVVASIISQILIKNIVKRPRPCTNSNYFQLVSTNFNCPLDYSFPSSHAATAFAAATVISAFDKKRKWLYFIIAILISLSRIYLGYHYFFDVAAGGLLGWIISKAILFFHSIEFYAVAAEHKI